MEHPEKKNRKEKHNFCLKRHFSMTVNSTHSCGEEIKEETFIQEHELDTALASPILLVSVMIL